MSQKCKLSKKAVQVKEQISEAVVCRCSSKWVFLKVSQIPQETTCVESPFNKVAGPETSTQVFSCEICEIFKNSYFTEEFQ